ncbi:hypothetical protein [Thermotoga profunda]|uniref:hypothetical protein n=1 Tax=Thermotoga profunda TaxID=1508420 RepID=UPI001E3A17C0|nr:hypothetical protein [Thermotoga profunda]
MLLIKYEFTEAVEKNSILLVQVANKLIESQILKKIEASFDISNRVPADYVELAKKIGGLFLYDENLKKIVVCIRKEQGVQSALVSLTDLSIPTMYFVTDTAGRIIAASEVVNIGERLYGIMTIQETNKVFKTKYRGYDVLAFSSVNPVYGFSVTTFIYMENILWKIFIPFVLCVCVGLTILLVLFQDHYRSKLVSIRKSLEKLAEGSADKVKIRDKKISRIIDELNENIQKKDRILKKAAQELEVLKQTLEKIRERKS